MLKRIVSLLLVSVFVLSSALVVQASTSTIIPDSSSYVVLFNGEIFDTTGMTVTEENHDGDIVRTFVDSDGAFVAMEVLPLLSAEEYLMATSRSVITGTRTFDHHVGDRHVGQCVYRVELDYVVVNFNSSAFTRIWVTHAVRGGAPHTTSVEGVSRNNNIAHATFVASLGNGSTRHTYRYTVNTNASVTRVRV